MSLSLRSFLSPLFRQAAAVLTSRRLCFFSFFSSQLTTFFWLCSCYGPTLAVLDVLYSMATGNTGNIFTFFFLPLLRLVTSKWRSQLSQHDSTFISISKMCVRVYIKRTASDIDVSSRTSGLRYAVFLMFYFRNRNIMVTGAKNREDSLCSYIQNMKWSRQKQKKNDLHKNHI